MSALSFERQGHEGRQRWRRRASDRAFALLATGAVLLGLLVVVVLLATTFLQARRLVSMRAAANTGLALSLRALQVEMNGQQHTLPYVTVAQADAGSQAYRLGLRRGDALVAVAGTPVRRVSSVWEALEKAGGGKAGRVEVAWIPRASEVFGTLQARALPGAVGRFAVQVTEIPGGSVAARAGLRPGDVLLEVGGIPITGTRQAWEALVIASQAAEQVPLRIAREGKAETVLLEPRRKGELRVSQSLLHTAWGFLSSLNEPRYPEHAGLISAIAGSLYVMAVMALVAFPLGVGAAVYLEEYARPSRMTEVLEVLIANLAGVPSAIYGIVGLEILARWMNLGRSILAGGITLALLVLPMMIIAAREALRAVPFWVREAAYSLGATRWQVVRHHVLPYSLPGVLTGMILSLSRAIGEAAPLLLLGAFLYVTYVPSSLRDTFTVVPLQIFDWATKPQDGFAEIAAAAILVLLAILMALNGTAIWLRGRYQVRW